MNADKIVDLGQFINLLDSRLTEMGKSIDPIEYIVSDDHHLVYIVNSKVACSSIKATFLDTQIHDNYSIHQLLKEKGMHKYHLSSEESSYYSFSFVRNPFSRLVSCYESKYHTDSIKYKHNDFEEYLFGYMAEDEGFESFIRKICALPPRLMDRHFRPQYNLLYDENGICRCNYIGHFETLEEDFKQIRERFELQALPHLNRSNEVNWHDYYTTETTDLVLKTFKNDFETFGYSW